MSQFDGLQINKNPTLIPILYFADDCIIFCKTNTKFINFIENTFKTLAEETGLNINWITIKAFLFSKITPSKRIKEICNMLNNEKGNMGEKYFGLPLNFQRITNETFFDNMLSQKPNKKLQTGIIKTSIMLVDTL